ncbi:MAG: glycosyltransferase family 2 protein [Chthoniobacterales bacterium]
MLSLVDLSELWQTFVDHWISEAHDLTEWPRGTFESLAEYIDLFPLVVCLLWCIYGVVSLLRTLWARRVTPAPCTFSVLIPFYAEPEGALRTAWSVAQVTPAAAEIILIDDGSPADSGAIEEAALPPRTRVLRLPDNRGKAAALNAALRETKVDFVFCLDADTVVETADWSRMLAKFNDAEIGGVTGKIWPSQTKTLPQLMQALDYLAVIGLVKNAEEQWGGLMTVSGAWVAFRRTALLEVGGWNEATAAEDIDLSWRLQTAGWRIAYDQRSVALVEMVPSWRALWRQRRRWSRGLGRAVRDHWDGTLRAGATHVPVVLVSVLGAAWLWASLFTGAVRLWGTLRHVLRGHEVFHPALGVRALVYAGICFAFFFLQVLIATLLDRARWRLYPKLFLLAPLYPVYFFAISLTTFLVGFPQGWLRRDRGRWRRTVRTTELATHTAPSELA